MKYKELLIQLDSHNETHPNFVVLWKTYIQQHRDAYKKACEKCQEMIILFDSVSDIKPETLFFLYMINKNHQVINLLK